MVSALQKPTFSLIYEGVEISGALDPETTSINYVDHLHGKADEIDITVQDKDGKWKGPWRPKHGDKMQLTIYDGKGGVLPAGVFEMDEPNASGGRGGDIVTIRGLAAPISKSLRTEFSNAFERQTTEDIVKAVAEKVGLEVTGEINELFHSRVTQRRERYLEFLKRLAEETGHYFNLRGDGLFFSNFATIDGRDPGTLVFHGDGSLLDYDFRFQAKDTFSKGKASYFDSRQKQNNEYEEADPLVENGDELRISGERLESAGHAEARVQSALHFANRERFAGSITCVGSASLVAGNVVELVGFGDYSGKRVIDSASHSLTRDGYEVTAELFDARS